MLGKANADFRADPVMTATSDIGRIEDHVAETRISQMVG